MNKKLIALLSTVSVFSINAAFAAEFNIPSGPTETNSQTLVGYENGTVNNYTGASISSSSPSFGITLWSKQAAILEFVGTSQVTQQTTGSISSVLYNQLNNTEDRYKNGHDHYYWTEGFGSYQQRPAVKGASQSDTTIGGILVGMDKQYNERTIIGAYAGGLKGQMKILDISHKKVKSNGAIIGAYGSTDLPKNSFVDVNIPIAYVDNKASRNMTNGAVAGGVEYDKGSFNEYYIAPNVTLGKNIDFKNFTLVPSIQASYIGQYIEGYTEHGGPSVQTVKGRYVNTVGGAAQIAIQKTLKETSEHPIQVSANIGVAGTRELGSRKIDIDLFGIRTNYKHGGPSGNVNAIAGLTINRGLMKKGFNVFAQLQGSKGLTNPSAHNYKIALDAGIEVKF